MCWKKIRKLLLRLVLRIPVIHSIDKRGGEVLRHLVQATKVVKQTIVPTQLEIALSWCLASLLAMTF